MSFFRLEFHTHTSFSSDSMVSPDKLVKICRQKGIDRVVITDHNTIAGARLAQTLAPELVIVGEEIMTTEGELLAAFLTDEIPGDLEPMEAIMRLKEQGAFISVSHPFDRFRSPWSCSTLENLLPFLDAIEVFNSRCLWPGFNHAAKRFARLHGLPGTCGSDAHTPVEIGMATMKIGPFDDAESLRAQICSAKMSNRLSGFWVHFASRQAARSKHLSRGVHPG